MLFLLTKIKNNFKWYGQTPHGVGYIERGRATSTCAFTQAWTRIEGECRLLQSFVDHGLLESLGKEGEVTNRKKWKNKKIGCGQVWSVK